MKLSDYPLIAITGAGGWLGRRLVRALTDGLPEFGPIGTGGCRVRCLLRPDEPAGEIAALGAETVAGDIRDPDASRALLRDGDCALVLHVAGLIHPGLRGVADFEAVNVGGSTKLLDAARAAGARRFVAMSSNSPLGVNPDPEHRFDESSPYDPYMGYGYSKWRLEKLLREAIANETGPEIVIARAPWFYGPGQPPRQTKFFQMVRDGKFPIMGKGLNRRSMGYVDSLALGLLLCSTVDAATGQTFWLADERPYPMVEIIDTVKAVLREDFAMTVKERNLHVPGVIADLARLVDYGLQAAGLYHQKLHVLSEMNLTIACDIGKAQRELGFRPLVELREGMRRSVEWCLENGQEI